MVASWLRPVQLRAASSSFHPLLFVPFFLFCRDGPAPATSGSGSGALYTGSSASSGVSSAGPSLPLVGPDQGFYRYACSSSYVLHHLETPTGYRFVLTTDPGVGDLRGALWHLYSEIFVGYALKNPLYQPGTTIDCTGFVSTVDGFIRALPAFGGVGNTGTGGAAIGGAGAVAGAGGGMTRL